MGAEEQQDDNQLVQLCRGGSHAAFEKLVRRHIVSVSSTAYALTGDTASTDDITQETFLAAWQKLEQLKEPCKVRAWLCAIARSMARAVDRGRKSDSLFSSLEIDPEMEADVRQRPDQQAMTAERNAIVWDAIEKIPEEYRLPLVLYYREGQSTAEVARALDISEAAVRQRLSRARGMLRRDIAALVEDALGTTPSQAFLVTAIVAATAGSASTVSAAGMAAATGMAAKAGPVSAAGVGATGAAGAFAGGLIGPAIGLAGGLIGARQSLRAARTSEERVILKRIILDTAILVALWLVLLGLLISASYRGYLGVGASILWGSVLLAAYVTGVVLLILRVSKKIKKLRVAGGYMATEPPILTFDEQAVADRKRWRTTLLASFGGAVFGSLSWLLILAALSQEFLLFGSTVVAGVLITGLATARSLKNPASYFLHAAAACLAVGMYTGLTAWLAWSPKLTKDYTRHNTLPDLMPEAFLPIATGIPVILGVWLIFYHYQRQRRMK